MQSPQEHFEIKYQAATIDQGLTDYGRFDLDEWYEGDLQSETYATVYQWLSTKGGALVRYKGHKDWEDLIHSAFLKLHEARANYDPTIRKWTAWATTALVNRGIDLYRKNRRMVLEADLAGEGEEDEQANSPLDTLLREGAAGPSYNPLEEAPGEELPARVLAALTGAVNLMSPKSQRLIALDFVETGVKAVGLQGVDLEEPGTIGLAELNKAYRAWQLLFERYGQTVPAWLEDTFQLISQAIIHSESLHERFRLATRASLDVRRTHERKKLPKVETFERMIAFLRTEYQVKEAAGPVKLRQILNALLDYV